MSHKGGFTIIEIVIVIVILGIAMLPLLTMYANVAVNSADSQVMRVSSFLGQNLMEEILTKRYDEEQDGPPWTRKDELGCTADGEDATDKSTFDDVDDFIDWLPPGNIYFQGFNNYTVETVVLYVDPDDLDTEASIGDGEYTDFKRIKVTIKFGGIDKVSIVSVKQGY